MLPKAEEMAVLLRQPAQATAPSQIEATSGEKQLMHMFRTEAALQMAGAFNQTLWTIDLLQVTQVYPVVWHAGIALAASYWRYNAPPQLASNEQSRAELEKLALLQYNKAIRHAINLTAKENPTTADKEVLLISNLMFTAICSLCGNIKNALEQFCQGLKLFNSFRLWEKPKAIEANPYCSPLCRESLITAFRRFAGQSVSLRDPSWPEWQTKEYLTETPPEKQFELPTEAYLEFEQIHNSLLDSAMARIYAHDHLMTQPQEDITSVFRRRVDSWKAKFQHLQESQLFNPVDMEAILLLRMRHLSLEILLGTGFAKMELIWDTFEHKFAKIISLTERLYELRGLSDASQAPRQPFTFSFTASVCEPLYLAARSCRNGAIRRRAIELLRKWPMNEGIFTSTILADVAEAVMNLEEGAAANGLIASECTCQAGVFVCHEHRVNYCHLTFPNHGEGLAHLRTTGEVFNHRPGRTILLKC